MENKRLKVENAQLIKQFQVVESKVSALENSLERVKTFTTKLKLITNVDAEDRITSLTMGPKPAAGGRATGGQGRPADAPVLIDKGKKAMDVARKRGIKDANGNWALNPQEQAIIDAAIDAGWRP